MTAAWKAAGLTYNRYLAVAARAIRRSLKEDKRLIAERRAGSELRFATWKNGKASDTKDLNAANAAAVAEHASS
ncbi:hypothetical protein ACHAQJ_004138 [Trichoderma viride]